MSSSGLGAYETWNAGKWKQALTVQQDSVFKQFVQKPEDSGYYHLSPLILSPTVARLYHLNFCETDTTFNGLLDHYIEETAIQQNKSVRSLDDNQYNLLHDAF